MALEANIPLLILLEQLTLTNTVTPLIVIQNTLYYTQNTLCDPLYILRCITMRPYHPGQLPSSKGDLGA